jgi:serine/threonine-protein kinase
VAVYDVSHSDELDYIVMELIDGITLKQYMQKKGLPLNWREALHFITQIMKALSHAHSRGIIHRDIKPQNIMVLRDGSVKVADFGIARLASAAQATLTQEALGSVHYISPEQARGSHIDCRADIYSAGVVLYEMTAGRLPYEGDTPVSVAIQHISSIPLPTRDINPDIPEALEAITMKAMASDVDKRYVSADAMLMDLEEFRKNPSINFEYTQEDLFQGDTVDEPTLIRGSDDSVTPRRRREDRVDEEDDPERRDRGGIWPILLAVGAILIFFGGIAYFLWSTVFGSILGDTSTELVVPDLYGMTIQEVERDIALGKIDSAFEIIEGRTVESDLPAGQIVNQDPEANEKKKGESIPITVDISAGPEQLIMPDVVNEEWRVAYAQLQDEMELKVTTEYENSDVTQNYVVRTEPLEGVVLEPGQEVKLVISLGPTPKTTMVPEFRNQTIEWAMERVNTLKLTLGDVEEISDTTHNKGTVIYQSIAPNTEVDQGTKISFQISSGPTDDESPTDSHNPDTSPSASDSPAPSTEQPTETSRTVYVELFEYSDPVQIRVEVGGHVQYNSTVDPAQGTFVSTITGTGQQQVIIYINDLAVQNYTVDFND